MIPIEIMVKVFHSTGEVRLEEKEQNIENVIRKIISISEIIETTTKLEVIKEDITDNIFIETALDGNADFIISYDCHVLDIKEFKDIKIVNPTEFIILRKRLNSDN